MTKTEQEIAESLINRLKDKDKKIQESDLIHRNFMPDLISNGVLARP